ncbi:tyrosine-type recombinase/integrase [Robertmurraya beringensis]|uniref:Tyrosine-type recombinase/integrase n=1 Tax=Robertmurraya beringensis TaxID=641660 RepID=A0ABV6KRN1_9BACI
MVFPNFFGGFKNPRNLLREFYGIIEKAGLQRMAFHNLRHSHATHLLN